MSSDDRVPLVFFPGLLCDELMWKHQVDDLGDVAECTVADFSSQDTVQEMARSALEHAPHRFALASLSMGGYVALEVMRQAPERVLRLALIDTQPHKDTAEQADRRRGFIATAQKGRFDEVVSEFPPLLFHEARLQDRALVDDFTSMAHRVGCPTFLSQQNAIIERPDSLDTLAGIECPTLVACGRQDLITPLENSELMAATIPGARLVIFDDCGHMSTMEVPGQVNSLLRSWLAQ